MSKKSTAVPHELLFAEIQSLSPQYAPEEQQGVIFRVNDRLLKAIKSRPVRHSGKLSGNAYVFGTLHPLDEYKFIGEHGNDSASTGFIDLTELREEGESRASLHRLFEAGKRAVKKAYPKADFDDRRKLAVLRKTFPWILWVGETQGGDEGAALYGHYDAKGELDSLIVDIYYFFTDENSGDDGGSHTDGDSSEGESEGEPIQARVENLNELMREALALANDAKLLARRRVYAKELPEIVTEIRRLLARAYTDAEQVEQTLEGRGRGATTTTTTRNRAPTTTDEGRTRGGSARGGRDKRCDGIVKGLQELARQHSVSTSKGGKKLRKDELRAALKAAGVCEYDD